MCHVDMLDVSRVWFIVFRGDCIPVPTFGERRLAFIASKQNPHAHLSHYGYFQCNCHDENTGDGFHIICIFVSMFCDRQPALQVVRSQPGRPDGREKPKPREILHFRKNNVVGVRYTFLYVCANVLGCFGCLVIVYKFF